MTDTVELYGFGDNDRSGKVRWTATELGLPVEEQRLRPPPPPFFPAVPKRGRPDY